MMDGVVLTACKWYDISSTCGLYYKNILTIVNDACTINVLHLILIALASVINYDPK